MDAPQSSSSISLSQWSQKKFFIFIRLVHNMAVQVVEFSNGGYKIRNIFCLKINILKGNYWICSAKRRKIVMRQTETIKPIKKKELWYLSNILAPLCTSSLLGNESLGEKLWRGRRKQERRVKKPNNKCDFLPEDRETDAQKWHFPL